MTTHLVYVHGLWLNGWESMLLRSRLGREMECRASAFSYPSVGADIATNARALGDFLESTSAHTLHLVAHSLGGLVVLELFERVLSAEGLFASGKALPPGRIVFLGSPVQGSRAAQHLARFSWGRSIMGLTANDVLVAPRSRKWNRARELGVIAGSLPVGLGRLMGPLEGPNDGTVLVEETRLPGATEHLTLRTSHSALIYSAAVARQAAAFLRNGRFDAPQD